MQFAHLHVHSHYSLLNALPKIPELVEAAKKDGQTALALTDDGNMYGTIAFYKACKASGIKPLIGVDFYVALDTRHDKRPGIDNRRSRLILIAYNNTGYKNLTELVTRSFLEGFYYKPRIDKELIKEHHEGLICISPQFSGEIARALSIHDKEKARALTHFYKEVFGDNFYLEITHHPEIEGQIERKELIVEFAREENVPLVAAHDVYYMRHEDRKAREVLVSVQNIHSKRRGGAFDDGGDDFSFVSQQYILEHFKDIPEAIHNTQKIASQCEVELDLDSWKFPNIEIPAGETYDSYLKKCAYKGLVERGLEETPEIKERIEYELKVIRDKGYSSYFLIVADLLHFAHEHGIHTNTRGSAAGSLVSYLVGITNINPIMMRLPFERFMNPERPSIPDIDMDFADNRRDEVIDYARQKYGHDHVAQIGTFGTMLARGSVRDTARALGYPYDLGDRIAKLVPMGAQGFPMTIDRAMEMTPELTDMYKKEKEVKEIIDLAKQIEGCARHVSVHAAGVVIAPTPLTDYTPLQVDPRKGKIITQYDMYTGKGEGIVNLPKFDFLGITNLTMLEKAVEMAEHTRGVRVDVENLPLDDPKAYELLSRGETMGIFQLAGDGMTRYLVELKPTNIFDISAMVALYRPGPMAFIPDYIERKHNPALVTYLDPRLETILKPTFGILIYQDDILLIATRLAGYSWGEADKFRKAVGKKIPEEMAAQKEKFISGCVDNGMEADVALRLWEMIETFAAYGFNKAHAASYGLLAYQGAYMKANFPVEYMTAVLIGESGDVEKVAEVINECSRMGIEVLPPDVNESFGDFTVVDIGNKDTGRGGKIRFGLFSVKNLGYDISQAIIDEREKKGKFSSFTDFLERIEHKNLNKKSMEALIMSGALDSLGERGALLGNLEEALRYHRDYLGIQKNQNSLFGADHGINSGFTLKETDPISQKQKLDWEKELLGLYISGHPLDAYKEKLAKRKADIATIKRELSNNMTCMAVGIITSVRKILTKKGDPMAFLKISDYSDSLEAVAFPSIFQKKQDLCSEDRCVAIQGRISLRNGEKSILIEDIKEL